MIKKIPNKEKRKPLIDKFKILAEIIRSDQVDHATAHKIFKNEKFYEWYKKKYIISPQK